MNWWGILISTVLLLPSICSIANSATNNEPFIVVIDAGHGGEDSGAVRKLNGSVIKEKDITLALARKTFQELRKLGIHSILTRYEDTHLTLDERIETANKAKAAAFISIHVNSSGDLRGSGTETYVFKATTNEASKRLAALENGKLHRVFKSGENPSSPNFVELIKSDLATTANYSSSVSLAQYVQRYTDKVTHSKNRGIKQALFYVLMKIQMPGVLFEPGFLSNPDELKKLKSEKFQKTIAQGLARGILNWRHNLPVNGSPRNAFAAQ